MKPDAIGWANILADRLCHVIPCDALGYARKGHTLAVDCQCKPRVQPETAKRYSIVTHNNPRAARSIH